MERLADDILWGARDIAGYVGRDERQIYGWAERRRQGKPAPPVVTEGGTLLARRSELNAHFSSDRHGR